MNRLTIAMLTTAIVAVAAIAGFLWWQRQPQPVAPPPVAEAPAEAPEPPAPVAAAPEHFEIPDTTPPEPLAALDKSDKQVTQALDALLGQKQVQRMLVTDGFVRRVVATVDNLGRSHVSPNRWPVNPTGGNFTVTGQGPQRTIGADNALRYAPLLNLVEAVNMRHAGAVYVRFYPLFQQAYEELGYPKKYFNDRLVQVLDLLITTPEPAGPVQVQLTEVKGPEQQLRPWVHYEFVDPQLESLASGQKILVRMGLVNERRAKAKLRELRAVVTNAREELKANTAAAPAAVAPAPTTTPRPGNPVKEPAETVR